MVSRKWFSIICTLFITLSSVVAPTYAKTFQSDPLKFYYGANLDLDGATIKEAMEVANQLDFDWVAVYFDWQEIWPDHQVNPDLSNFIRVVTSAQQKNINVMLTIANPPAWALTPQGPNHQLTIHLVSTLVNAFPDTIKAVELFPGANTLDEWGAAPDAAGYLSLIKEVMTKFSNAGQDTIVLPSLAVTQPSVNPEDLEVVRFLNELYQAGGRNWMPILAIRFHSVKGNPLDDPEQLETVSLRYYERIRQEMIRNQHADGMLWITGFSWPSTMTASTEQVVWLRNAYQLLKAQLYIGAAFFSWFNKPGSHTPDMGTASLISDNAEQHPACIVYVQLRPDTSVEIELLDAKPFVKMMPKNLVKKTSP